MVQLEGLEALVILLLIHRPISPCILLHHLIVPIGKCFKKSSLIIKVTKIKTKVHLHMNDNYG